MQIAIYPGSFDPVTYGHLDVIERAALLFDEVVVAVSRNASKKPLFSVAERVDMLKLVLSPYSNVKVDSFDGLTINYAGSIGAKAIIRGLRVISDFENEFMMALTNKKLCPNIETVFLMTRSDYSFITSSGVKEIAYFGGCVEKFVPPEVERRLTIKFVDRREKRGCGGGTV